MALSMGLSLFKPRLNRGGRADRAHDAAPGVVAA